MTLNLTPPSCTSFDLLPPPEEMLRSYVQEKKRKNSRWSLQMWGRELGLTNKATLSNILSGRTLPSKKLMQSLARSLQLNSNQRKVFFLLIDAKKTKSAKEAASLRKRALIHYQLERFSTLEEDLFSTKLSPASFWMKEFFRGKTKGTPQDFKSALRLGSNTLEQELSSIQDLDVTLVMNLPHFYEYAPVQSQECVIRFHEQSAELAKEAVRKIPREERAFSSTVIRLKKSDLPKLQAYLDQARKKFALEYSTAETNETAVFQINVQAFPVTKWKK